MGKYKFVKIVYKIYIDTTKKKIYLYIYQKYKFNAGQISSLSKTQGLNISKEKNKTIQILNCLNCKC